jgi:ATP-dependent Zn protease
VESQRTLQRAIFPLVIVAALIWLAAQTLGGGSSSDLRFSQALAFVRQNPHAIDHVTFHPSTQEVDLHLTSGKTRTTVYPLDASGYELQKLLEDERIPFNAKRRGSSPAWSILTSLLPFVLLLGFWILLMRQVRQGSTGSLSQETPFSR